MKLLLASLLLMLASLAQAAEPRFDAVYFFQSEQTLQDKQVNIEDLARFSRKMQSNVWNALKKASMPNSSGFLVVAVRSDGEIAAWLDMEPALHEYYDNQVIEAVKKVPPFAVAQGTVVFGIKMLIDTPKWLTDRAKHTARSKPAPKEWKKAQETLANPGDMDELMLAVWPE
ncbi:MAG: hypothetical protein Q7U12_03665 [Undibacterium sp.]|nr:hypothetical protein [Undibacterium sp.]